MAAKQLAATELTPFRLPHKWGTTRQKGSENSAESRLIPRIIQPSFRRLAGPLGSGGKNQGSSLGAIAQLVERLNGIQEVSGSTPLSSTINPSPDDGGGFSF